MSLWDFITGAEPRPPGQQKAPPSDAGGATADAREESGSRNGNPITAPGQPAPPAPVRARAVNYLGVIVGPPEHGKSSLASAVGNERAAAGAWVFAHDPNRQFGGAWYESADAWRAAAAMAAQRKVPLPRVAAFGGSFAELGDLVVGLGRRYNRVDAVTWPMHLIGDEATLLDTSGASWMAQQDAALLANRRHLGITATINLQWPTQLSRAWYLMSTDIYLFRVVDSDWLDKAEKWFSLGKGALADVSTLPPHRYVHLQPGKGRV